MPSPFGEIDYPADWIRRASVAERAAIGITEEPDPPAPPSPARLPNVPAAVAESYRANLIRQADTLLAKGQSYDAVKLLLKSAGVKS